MKGNRRMGAIALSAALMFTVVPPAAAESRATPMLDVIVTEYVTLSSTGGSCDLTHSDLIVKNQSRQQDVIITSIRAQGINGWTLLPMETDFTAGVVNRKELALAGNGCDLLGEGYMPQALVPPGGYNTTVISGKTCVRSTPFNDLAAEIVVTYQMQGSVEPEPVEIVSWADGTDKQLLAMLEAHYRGELNIYDYWHVGDERKVSLMRMEAADGVGESHAPQTVSFCLVNAGGKLFDDGTACAFIVEQRDSLMEPGGMNQENSNVGGWEASARRAWCNHTYLEALPPSFRALFRPFQNSTGRGGGQNYFQELETTVDTFALPAEKEVYGTGYYSVWGEGEQWEHYKTVEHRIKRQNGSQELWMFRSPHPMDSRQIALASKDGSYAAADRCNGSYGLAPFGCI